MPRKYKTLSDYFEQTGRTQVSLAQKVGVTTSYISHVVAGRKQPSLRVALRIATATGVPLPALVADRESAA